MAIYVVAIPIAVLVKVALAAGATVGSVYAINLSITVVRNRARQESPNKKLKVRREQEGEFIRIVLEASGKSAVWLTKKLDAFLEDLLPECGKVAEI
jgi:hypothetical protein